MDFLSSFFQNVKDKLTSPFFGTLSFVFIIHHWEFWYTLFNFDQDCTRSEKIAILSLLGKKEFGARNILYDIATALIIMIIGYGIVMATRTLSLALDFRFMPLITGKIISSKVVERSVHEEVVQERDEYSEKYEEQRKNVRNLSKDYDKQTEQIEEKNKLLNANTDEISGLKSQLKNANNNLDIEKRSTTSLALDKESLKGELDTIHQRFDSIEEQNEIYSDNIKDLMNLLIDDDEMKPPLKEDVPGYIIKRINDLQKSGDWQTFIGYYDYETYGGTMDVSSMHRMQELGLANRDRRERLTPLGRLLGFYKDLF